jgi:hypothetical protein
MFFPEVALDYNTKKNGTLWKLANLPWPYYEEDPSNKAFALLIASFQRSHGLTADGCLGPSTLSTMREVAKKGIPDDHVDEAFVEYDPTRVQSVPTRKCSNILIFEDEKIKVDLTARGITVSNYVDDGEHHFSKTYRYKKPIERFVIHESGGGREAARVVKTLKKKGYGVHLLIAPDGHVSQHANLGTERLVHANQANATSIGLEIVNPYKATNILPPFTRTIPAKWWTWVPKGAPKLYVTPTDAQLHAARAIVPFVCKRLGIPLEFPTAHLGSRNTRISGWKDGAVPEPGVMAHRDFASHADGRFILEDLMAYQKGGGSF